MADSLAAAPRARIPGAMIGAAFGTVWALWGAQLLFGGIIAPVIAALPGIVLIAFGLRRYAKAPGGGRRRPPRRYALVVIGEVIALNIVAQLLSRYGAMEYLLPGIAFIVGGHFLFLRRTLGEVLMVRLGVAMMTAAVAAMIAITAGVDPALAGGIDALANAVMLWTATARAILGRQ